MRASSIYAPARGGVISRPSLSLSLGNSRATFNGPGACREPTMKPAGAFPGSTRTAQGSPCRFRAPHFGRSLRRSGPPLPSSPISRIARQADPILHFGSAQVVPRRGQAKNSHSYHEGHAARVIPLSAGGPAAIMRARGNLGACSSLRFDPHDLKTYHFCVSLKAHDARARPRVYVSKSLDALGRAS